MESLRSAIEFIRKQKVARVATFSKEGIHLVPICPVYDGRYVYFSTGAASKKVKNLKRNKKISIVFDEYSDNWAKLKGISVQGEAEIIEKGEEFDLARKMLYEKFPQYKKMPIREGESVIVKIKPTHSICWGV